MKQRLLSLLWSRPSGKTEWAFSALIGLMAIAGATWLLTHGDSETRESFEKFLGVLRGESDLRARTPEFVAGGLYLTAIVWLLAAIGLWLTRFWWLSASPRVTTSRRRILDPQFLIGLGVILLVALGIRWPRMELSLYNDEVDVFRTSIVGGYGKGVFDEIHNDALPEFRPVPWLETFWGNRIGNNHSLHSILARLGNQGWHAVRDAPPRKIFEVPLRLPALFGGLLSIAAIGCLGRLLTGSPRAGWFAAVFLSIHPWHLRYSTEARGYGLVFGFSVLALLFLLLAIDRGKWRWWLAFGAAQFCTLWSCLGSLHLILAINLIAGAAFLVFRFQQRSASPVPSDPVRWRALPCWMVVNVLSAAIYLFVAAPLLPPVKRALDTNVTFQQGVPAGWIKDTASHSLVGMPWLAQMDGNPLIMSLATAIDSPLVLVGALLGAALALTGWIRLLLHRTVPGFIVAAAPVLAVALQWISSKLGGSTLLPWYANYVTVFVALWMGIGLWTWIFRARDESEERGRDRLLWQRLATYGLVVLFLAAIYRPLTIYRAHAKQSLKEAILHIRGGTFPLSEEQQIPLIATWWTHINFYDPNVRIAYGPETLLAMMERSRTESRSLWYVLGAQRMARAENPKVLEILEESGDFTHEKTYYGLEDSQFSLWIYRLKPSEDG